MFVVCAAVAVVAFGCDGDGAGRKQTSSSSTAVVLKIDDAANATYSGIYDTPIRLSDGRYEGEPFEEGGASRPTVVLVDDIFETGDLDGDGTREAAVLLVESSGGTESNVFVTVLGHRDGEVANIGTSLIGDRVQIRSFSVHDAQVFIDVLQHGPEDPMCCPTQKATRTWALGENALAEASSTENGTMSLEDLMGLQWVLKSFSPGEPVPESLPLTLHFTEGRVWGNGGCNNYFTDMIESSPGEIELNKIGITRMACEDAISDLESRFIKTLQGTTNYGFAGTKLVLTCTVGDSVTTMYFAGHIP